MLDNFENLKQSVLERFRGISGGAPSPFRSQEKLFCSFCGDFRRMDIRLLYPNVQLKAGTEPELFTRLPCLFSCACVECEGEFTAVADKGPNGPDLAVLSNSLGGIKTQHTPFGIGYYLDQAQRAESGGARSAAVSMYRGALEHLLFEQGYKTGMCGSKVTQLENDIKTGTAPVWARDLDTDFLRVLNELGNGSIHPNDGDVQKKKNLDVELLAQVKETFLYLLFIVYEAPHKRSQQLTALQAKAQSLKK